MAKKHHRHHHLRDDDLVGATATAEAQTLLTECGKKNKPKLILPMLLLFPIISYTLLFAPRFTIAKLPFYYNGTDLLLGSKEQIINPQPCSSTTIFIDDLCCDRTGFRSDVCYMRGDIRTNPATSSIIMYPSTPMNTSYTTTSPSIKLTEEITKPEKIKPYTRKWETAIMDTITELNLVQSNVSPTSSVDDHRCDVRHSVPAVVFSTGGYTGNLFHEFNDGIIPLYLTSRRYNKQVVFVVVDYHNWWLTKYADVLSHLSLHPIINFFSSPRKNENGNNFLQLFNLVLIFYIR